MTKIQLSFDLSTPLDEQLMNRIGDVYGTYGILRIRAQPGGQHVTVEYDATRFSPKDVEAALARAGLPLAQRSV
jgi:hypothetical protein